MITTTKQKQERGGYVLPKEVSRAGLDEILASAIMIEIFGSSGFSGPGVLQVVTEGGDAYIARFSKLGISDRWELGKIHPMFALKESIEGSRRPFLAEENGWTYIERERLLVRDDFLEAFHAVYAVECKKPENKVRCIDTVGMVRLALMI